MRSSESRYSEAGLLLVLVLVCLAGQPTLAQTEQDEVYGDAYAGGDYGRVRYEENGLTILRSETEAIRNFPSAAQVNAPIFPGDSVETDAEQRAEIQLAGGSLVRIDHGSRVVFLSLSDPYREIRDHTVLQLAAGTLRVEAAIDEREEFRVDTPACAVYVLGDADLRIEVDGDRTRVASRRGIAEVDTGAGALVVRGGMSTEVLAGEPPRDSRPFNTFLADDFDRWVASREDEFAVGNDATASAGYHELPAEVRPYYGELARHGTWTQDEAYGHVWVPRTTVVGWRPYRHGRWGYGSRGYFWVSHEPWGWAPYHYGRWTWIPGFGWSWVPGRVFGGAWVSWSWGSSHLGWCALDYWNRPVRRAGSVQGAYDAQAWTFAPYDHIASPDPASHHVGPQEIADLNDAVVVTRPPRVAPRELGNVEQRNRAVADARASTRALVTTASEPGDATTSRSFVDLERQAGLRRKLARTDAAVVAPTSDPGGTASPGVTSGRTSLGPSSLRGSNPKVGTKSPADPAVRQPLVRSNRDDLKGASERWKDVYRQMAQPRPTRSQAPSTPESSAPSEAEKPGRESPTRRKGVSRQPEADKSADDDPPAQRSPSADARTGRGSRNSPKHRFAERRPVSSSRSTTARIAVTTRAPVRPQRPTQPKPVSRPAPDRSASPRKRGD